ncbi:glomulin-like [Oncorhynchus kisutch]|uniref:Glomulin, FKBP associated protein b n=1 Tax=Oncorhynchus kisutch TaxID=8019 RepID=A0A8C7KR48_ONCKI|nr:glomulin-like [Oncorhynchus kisutch]
MADQLQDVIQRWRKAVVEDGLRPEDHELFQNAGLAYINQGDTTHLLDFIQDEKNQGIVESMGCGLLASLVAEVLKRKKSSSTCKAVITHLAETCSPMELMLIFLGQVDDLHPDLIADTIVLMAPLLQTVLLRLGEEKAPWVGLALAALQKQVSRLPVPYTKEQEVEDAYGLCRCCSALARFMEPFVEEVKRRDNSEDGGTASDNQLKTELLKFCMGSLREPLLQAQLDQAIDIHKQSPLWHFATDILATLPAIQEPLPGLLFYKALKKREESGLLTDSTKAQESRACLAYLLFVQLITIESFPAVFSPVFVLQCNMEYIDLLLSRKEESFLLKGLELYTKSLERVEDNSLPVELLDLKSFYSVPQHLVQILTVCPIQHLREQGFKVLQLFIDKLGPEAKHKFFRCMIKTSCHAGVEGYIIKNIKNQIELSLKPGHENEWFMGIQVLPLLRLVLCFPRGPETDLLNSMDRVMESLNLLRYLHMRDMDWQQTSSIWSELFKIKEDYLKMLRVCLALSRAYYTGQVKNMREDKKIQAQEAREARVALVQTMTVKNKMVSDMSPEMQYQVLQCALVTFDLMESLVIRIEEISEEKVKTGTAV